MDNQPPLEVINHAPDSDTVTVRVAGYQIDIWRDALGRVYIDTHNGIDMFRDGRQETHIVLGEKK